MSDRFIEFGLGMVFLALIAILVAVSYLGLRAIDSGQGEARLIVANQWIDVQLADEALSYSNQNNRINMRSIETTSRSEFDSLIATRKENSDKISQIIKKLQSRVGSKNEQSALDAVLQTRTPYTESYRNAIQLVVQHKKSEARVRMLRETAPLLVKYHTAWNEFVHYQTEEMNRKLDVADATYARTRSRTVRLIAVSIILVIGIGAFVIRKITVEVRRREDADSNLRHLNEQLELKVLERTAAIEKSNRDLSKEIAERKRVEDSLRSKTAFLEAQTNSTMDGILVVDRNGRRILQNQAFLKIFGIPHNVAKDNDDKACLEFVSRAVVDREAFLQKVNYLYEHEDETTHDELELMDGTFVDRFSAPVLGADRTYYGRLWVFHDITERKRSEEAVRLLSAAVEQSPVSIVITDLNGDILYVNRKFVECTGYSREEAIGKNPRILKSGNTSSGEYKGLWETITAGKEWRGEFQNRKKDGSLYWEIAVIRPIRDEKGNLSRFLAIKEDVTERHNMEEQLRRSQKLESIGQLAAGIAHEINTPMQFIGDNTRFIQQAWNAWTPVIDALGDIRDGKLNEDLLQQVLARLQALDLDELRYLRTEIPNAIEQCLGGVERVSRIVQAMKRFSHPGSEEKQPIDINQAIETTITVARNEWKYVSEVETALAPDIGLVPCYGGEFNQVILNLLVNAAQAIAPVVGQHAKGKITISTRRDNGWAEISIRDTGCGIPTEIQPRIFDPFFTTKDVGKGTGQGLALAHAVVVKRHGGKIWFESEVGKGTTFFIRLPIEVESSGAPPLNSSLSQTALV